MNPQSRYLDPGQITAGVYLQCTLSRATVDSSRTAAFDPISSNSTSRHALHHDLSTWSSFFIFRISRSRAKSISIPSYQMPLKSSLSTYSKEHLTPTFRTAHIFFAISSHCTNLIPPPSLNCIPQGEHLGFPPPFSCDLLVNAFLYKDLSLSAPNLAFGEPRALCKMTANSAVLTVQCTPEDAALLRQPQYTRQPALYVALIFHSNLTVAFQTRSSVLRLYQPLMQVMFV